MISFDDDMVDGIDSKYYKIYVRTFPDEKWTKSNLQVQVVHYAFQLEK